MSIENILKKLPNGFHDAKMNSINIDYISRTVIIAVDIFVETYKSSQLIISDFEFCIIDVPDKNYPFFKKAALTIDIGIGQPSTDPIILPGHKKENFLMWIWVEEWNSFIRISANQADLKWT